GAEGGRPVVGARRGGEGAGAELVAAEGRGAPRLVGEGLGFQVLARLDGAAAPGAGGQLVGRADPSPARPVVVAPELLDGFGGVVALVRRGAPAHPQADAERRLAPALVALIQSVAVETHHVRQ